MASCGAHVCGPRTSRVGSTRIQKKTSSPSRSLARLSPSIPLAIVCKLVIIIVVAAVVAVLVVVVVLYSVN